MSRSQSRWDIGDEVVDRKRVVRPIVDRALASSAITAVFSVLMVSPALHSSYTSTSRPILEIVRIPRKDVQEIVRKASGTTDTQIGMSSRRLANLFPVLFEPSEDEDEGQPYFMS